MSDVWSDPSSTSIIHVCEQRIRAVLPEPLLVAYVISTIISWAVSFNLKKLFSLSTTLWSNAGFKNIDQKKAGMLMHKIQIWMLFGWALLFSPPKDIHFSSAIYFLCRIVDILSLMTSVATVPFEPHRDKTNKLACAPSEDSDQPGHPPSLLKSLRCALNG